MPDASVYYKLRGTVELMCKKRQLLCYSGSNIGVIPISVTNTVILVR